MKYTVTNKELALELDWMDPGPRIANKAAVAHSDSCLKCYSFEMGGGTKGRLFPSRDAFIRSAFYAGEDIVKDDPNGVTIAVWSGKNNVGRGWADWWMCWPMHPNCGHEPENFEFGESEEMDDWFSRLDNADYTVEPS